MALYKHLGYYNDKEDIKTLFKASKRMILTNWRNDMGHFYKCDDELQNGADLMDKDCLGKDGDKFIIRLDVPKYKKDITEDNFIDIYLKVKEEE